MFQHSDYIWSASRAVAEYLRWIYSDGQRIARERGYATLPKELLAKVAASGATVR